VNLLMIGGHSVEASQSQDAHDRTPHIGIVAGTADGAALCYRTICHEAPKVAGLSRQPQVTLHGVPADLYLDAIDRDDWSRVARLMSQSAATLASAGADLIVCPNNTLHRAVELVVSPIPWLHIAAVVVAEATRRRFRRIGLIGTHVVMEGPIYLPRLRQRQIEPLLPDEQERIRLQHIIRTELIAGRFTRRSRAVLQQVIARMAVNGADAVILACTELPLLLGDESTALPVLDSTRLLAMAALQHVTNRTKEATLIQAATSQRGV
jgi:aspartate racemase